MKTILKTIVFATLMAFAGAAFGLGTFQPLTPGLAPVSAGCVDKAEAAAILGRAATKSGFRMSDRGLVLSGKTAQEYARLTNHPNPEVVYEMVIVTFVHPQKQPMSASVPFDEDGCNIYPDGSRVSDAEEKALGLIAPWRYAKAALAQVAQSET